MKKNFLLYFLLFFCLAAKAENGYDLWLRYKPVENKKLLENYRQQISSIVLEGDSPTLQVIKEELTTGLSGLLLHKPLFTNKANQHGTVLIGTPASFPLLRQPAVLSRLQQTGEEGYIILSTTINGKKVIVISANTDKGLLYGSFHFLRLLQTQQSLQNLE